MQASQQLRERCHAFLLTQLPQELHGAAEEAAGRGQLLAADGMEAGAGAAAMEADEQQPPEGSPARWGIPPFYVEQQRREGAAAGGARFDFGAPTTGRNALRVLRALQLRKPILLEGSPGVGKTSLIAAMAKAAGARRVL